MHNSNDRELSAEEQWLLRSLSVILNQGEWGDGMAGAPVPDWDRLLQIAQHHAVLPLLYPVLEQGNEIPASFAVCISNESRQTVQQSYRLMFLTHYLVERMQEAGLRVAVLKGAAAAGCYPVPELRKSGDIDLLLTSEGTYEEAEHIMDVAGFEKKEGHSSHHHQVWRTEEGIDIELHVMLAEPFDDRRVNAVLGRQLREMDGRIRRENVMGLEFPVLEDGDHAYYLLLHMLHHFLRAGFGLKLLCDWVVFWNKNRTPDEIGRYRNRVLETGLTGFSDMVTSLCVEYFGLAKQNASQIVTQYVSLKRCRAFMRDILDAGEFGMQDEGRMVIARGGGLAGYLREFHHQMCLNHPKKSKVLFLWPALWVLTLVRFINNNRKLRGISTFQVLKKAGERGRKIRHLKLFCQEIPSPGIEERGKTEVDTC